MTPGQILVKVFMVFVGFVLVTCIAEGMQNQKARREARKLLKGESNGPR